MGKKLTLKSKEKLRKRIYNGLIKLYCMGLNTNNYEKTLDNETGLIILFNRKKASSFETHDAIVTIYRDENNNILAIEIEYTDNDDSE